MMREDRDEWPADQVERWPLTKLIPYARNARKQRDRDLRTGGHEDAGPTGAFGAQAGQVRT